MAELRMKDGSALLAIVVLLAAAMTLASHPIGASPTAAVTVDCSTGCHILIDTSNLPTGVESVKNPVGFNGLCEEAFGRCYWSGGCTVAGEFELKNNSGLPVQYSYGGGALRFTLPPGDVIAGHYPDGTLIQCVGAQDVSNDIFFYNMAGQPIGDYRVRCSLCPVSPPE